MKICHLHEIIKLRNILIKNNFQSKFIDRCIKIFFDNLFSAKKKTVPTVPKKVVNISLPFLGKLSLKIRGNLIKLAKTYFPCCKIHSDSIKSDLQRGLDRRLRHTALNTEQNR